MVDWALLLGLRLVNKLKIEKNQKSFNKISHYSGQRAGAGLGGTVDGQGIAHGSLGAFARNGIYDYYR